MRGVEIAESKGQRERGKKTQTPTRDPVEWEPGAGPQPARRRAAAAVRPCCLPRGSVPQGPAPTHRRDRAQLATSRLGRIVDFDL